MGTSAKDFFSKQEKEDIKQAIMNAELDTSGEIRVHIENTFTGEVMDRAAFIFKQLGMNKTVLHNGVLIYLAVKNRRFAIIGDSGINSVVPGNFWNDIKGNMLNQFRENRFTEGLIEAITSTGIQLKKHFPHHRDDVNELPDDISFGKD
ncbi:MAG: TPM domain-containing protein [Bacteroidetes bacterium]|nr:TPM domain-containing protein [Bacteroidota bacterium]